MNQKEIQLWNDAVNACYKAAWEEVQEMERQTPFGLPHPARQVVKQIGKQLLSGDDRKTIPINLRIEDFPKPT